MIINYLKENDDQDLQTKTKLWLNTFNILNKFDNREQFLLKFDAILAIKDPEILKIFVKNFSKLNLTKNNFKNAINSIIQKNDFDMLQTFLNVPHNLESLNNKWNAIEILKFTMKYNRDDQILNLLITCINDFSFINTREGLAIIELAKAELRVGALKLMMENGYNPNLSLGKNNTILLYATKINNYELVQAALHFGAHVDGKETLNDSPLMVAAQDGYEEIARLLIENKADVNFFIKSDKTTPLSFAVANNHYNVAKLLLENGANPNFFNKNDFSHIMYAAQNGNEKTTKLLLMHNADPNLCGSSLQITPLMIAVNAGRYQVCKTLLNYGADPNALDTKDKKSALMIACDKGNYEIAKLLLESGANPNFTSSKGITALNLAQISGNVDLLKLLVHEYNVKFNISNQVACDMLMTAIWQSNAEIVKSFLEIIDIDSLNGPNGHAALNLAQTTGSLEIAKLLINYGLEANLDQSQITTQKTETINNQIKKNNIKTIIFTKPQQHYQIHDFSNQKLAKKRKVRHQTLQYNLKKFQLNH